MHNTPRVFPSRLEKGPRRVYRAVTCFYILLFFALLWPVYPRFASIEPRVLGLPFSLTYVIGGVLLSFVVLWSLLRWENRRADGSKAEIRAARPGVGPGLQLEDVVDADGEED